MKNTGEVSKKSLITQGPKARSQKLQQIDALYRQQIKLIYTDANDKIEKTEINKAPSEQTKPNKKENGVESVTPNSKQLQSVKSASTLYLPQSQQSSKFSNSGLEGDKMRASMFLRGQSTRTVQILRRQNETKELRIRELTNKCQNLVQKLKKHLVQEEFQAEMETLRQFTDSKMERLEHLFKIKQEEIFFKIKLQVIALLQEFGVPKDELSEFNQVASESSLFSLMTRKLKGKLRDFRSRQQENSFSMQKDRILYQKQEERIHYLTETNEIQKLSEQKLKVKIEDLKVQLNQYLDKMRAREQKNEENENQLFRMRKQNEELQSSNQRLVNAVNSANLEREEEKRMWEFKEKEMKSLLNNYFVEKKKLQTDIEEKDGEQEELIIRLKFLEQENERANRELIRWKERFQWLQKQKQIKLKEAQEDKATIIASFDSYKLENNQSILMQQKAEIEEGLRKIEEYQRNYERVVLELEEERRLLERSEEQADERYQQLEAEWLDRLHKLEQIKDQQLDQINTDFEGRIDEQRTNFAKKEELLGEEMQARLKAQLAEKDRKATEEMIELETENQQLRREIGELEKIIEVKESLINVLNGKRGG